MTTTENPPLPSPPFFTVPNINNLRDAALHSGGLSTPGGPIRPGILFRSAETSKLDREGWGKMREIGIGHVFDLRSKPEIEKGWKAIAQVEGKDDHEGVTKGWEEAMEQEGVKRSWVPVFEATDYSPERLAERYAKYMDQSVEGFVHAYHDILLHAGPSFRQILDYLIDLPRLATEPKGALIHCTAGKDRTGIFFGILFSFLGVPHNVIAEEYHLTEAGLGHVRDEVVARLMQSPGVRKYLALLSTGKAVTSEEAAEVVQAGGDVGEDPGQISDEALEQGRQAALRMVGARKESMLGALELVSREWGSAEGYLRKIVGLEDVELEALRHNLVVQEA